MRYIFENRKDPLTIFQTEELTQLPHIHTHLELIYLLEGSSIGSLDGKEYLIESGDLFVSYPNQIHFYHDRTLLLGYVLIFAGELFPDLLDQFKNKVAVDPVVKRQSLPEDFPQRFQQLHDKLNSNSPYHSIAAKGHLLVILSEVLPLMKLTDNPVSQDSIKSILMYCMENFTEPLTLDILARDLHLSKYYISHVFQKQMQTGFLDFVNNLRLERACELLSRDQTITEAAYASGFSSIRSFNRIFAGKMGMTPTQYIKRKQMER